MKKFVVSVAEEAGDTNGAGLAALTLIEELASELTHDELSIVIDRAEKFLAESRDLATVRRLAIDACNVVSVIRNYLEFPPSVDWTKFSLPDAVRRYEAHFIKLALKDAGGKITRAARLLGFKRHQSLTSPLKTTQGHSYRETEAKHHSTRCLCAAAHREYSDCQNSSR